MSLNVRVITPDKVVWDAMADELILPSSTGQIGILTDHAPLLTALDIGVMRLKSDAGWTSIVLMEGFAEVDENKVTILCNGAEEGSSIDLKTAQDALEKVTLLVDEATTKKEKIEATIELRKSKARLQAVFFLLIDGIRAAYVSPAF
jgi:F-type H+-transporting ATPase subunit epsilon